MEFHSFLESFVAPSPSSLFASIPPAAPGVAGAATTSCPGLWSPQAHLSPWPRCEISCLLLQPRGQSTFPEQCGCVGISSIVPFKGGHASNFTNSLGPLLPCVSNGRRIIQPQPVLCTTISIKPSVAQFLFNYSGLIFRPLTPFCFPPCISCVFQMWNS